MSHHEFVRLLENIRVVMSAILVFSLISVSTVFGQCGGTNPALVNANPVCDSASLIITNGTYTGSTANFPPVPGGGHWLDGISTGLTVENIGYYKFVAGSTSLQFTVCSGTCGFYGTQIYIFKTCGNPASKVLTVKQICNGCGSITLSNGGGYTSSYTNNGSGCYTITLNGLTVGDTYYWGVDGYQGSNCNYSIQFNNGIQTNPTPITPTFAQLGPYCVGSTPGTLPTSSTNVPAITGTWLPAVVSTASVGSTTYKFTPASGQCADSTTMIIVVNPKPTIAVNSPTICSGQSATLTATGGSTYSWSGGLGSGNPKSVSPASTTTYTVTGTDVNGCSNTATSTVTTTASVTPTFTNPGPVCANSAFSLPAVSNNGISGVWSPAINNTATTTYTFTPNAGQCANTTTITVVVNTNPTIAVNSPTICSGQSATLTATGGSTYSWSGGLGNGNPKSVSPASTTTYTVTGTDANGCTNTATSTVTISTGVVPTFTNPGPVCTNGSFALPTVSNEGITGSWSPAVNNTTTTTYSFTPDAGQCANSTTMTVVVSSSIVPTFTQVAAICSGAALNPLPTTSNNGITGTWSPVINNTATTTYTFTPGAGQCAGSTTMSVTVNLSPAIAVNSPVICSGQSATLTATGGSTYSWSGGLGSGNPKSVSPASTTTYTVTGTDANGCTNTATSTVTISTGIVPTFTNPGPICSNSSLTLPTVSNEGITGSWSPAANNTTTTTYSFTPDAGQCANSTTMTVVVSSSIIPVFTQAGEICSGTALTPLPTTSNNGITGTWSPAINNTATTTYTFTPDAGQCTNSSVTMTIVVNQMPQVTVTTTHTVCTANNGTALAQVTGGSPGYSYTWSPVNSIDSSVIDLSAGQYDVTVTDSKNCTAIANGSVNQTTYTVVIALDTIMNVKCNGENNGAINVTISSGTTPYNYTWNTSPAQNTEDASNLPAGNYAFTVSDKDGCTSTASYVVTEPAAINLNVTDSRTRCATSTDGIVNSSISGGTGVVTVSLLQAGNILQSNISGNFTGVAAGSYTVEAEDENGCTVSQNIVVAAAPFNTYQIHADSISCYGSQYSDGHIFVEGLTIDNAPYQYSIDGGSMSNNNDFYNLAAGNHTVTVRDNYGCDTTFSVIISQPQPATLTILPADSTLQSGESVELQPVFGPYSTNNISNYQWTPVAGLSCTNCANPFATPALPEINYHLIITYNSGCTVEGDVRIFTEDNQSLFIPNVFSPNGDGNNDVFVVYGNGIKNFNLKIFNRWGELVFESANQQAGWDGNYKGTQQLPGVYVYVAEVTDLNNDSVRKRGSLTLIR